MLVSDQQRQTSRFRTQVIAWLKAPLPPLQTDFKCSLISLWLDCLH